MLGFSIAYTYRLSYMDTPMRANKNVFTKLDIDVTSCKKKAFILTLLLKRGYFL